MPSGQSVNSRANLTRGGGDRRAGERALVAVIAAALAGSLSDAEIRRFFGLAVGQDVTAVHRERMAAGKARETYRAILEGWRAGMMTPLEDGGVNIGGIIRLGTRARRGVLLDALDIYGDSLAGNGVAIYKRGTFANGFYARAWGGMTATAEDVAALIALGWMNHWSGGLSGVGGALWWGPVEGAAWDTRVTLPYHGGSGTIELPVEYFRWGTRNIDGSGFYAWAYVDGGGVEHQVKWVNVGIKKAGRVLKSEVPNLFWCELNGVVP